MCEIQSFKRCYIRRCDILQIHAYLHNAMYIFFRFDAPVVDVQKHIVYKRVTFYFINKCSSLRKYLSLQNLAYEEINNRCIL